MGGWILRVRTRNAGQRILGNGTSNARQRRQPFCAAAFGLGLVTFAAPFDAAANPEGGTVVGGSATLSADGKVTTIDQSSDRVIIDWRTFDIEVGETTRFNQPGADSIALNRVLDNTPSRILGTLSANGQVWLVNPAGVMFGPNAKVDVNSLVVTTADIANDDFLKGADPFDFSIPATDPAAAIINEGGISIGDYGLAALVAPHVRNDGLIVGRAATVVLAGAETFTVDLYGDNVLTFAATGTLAKTLRTTGPVIENAGTIDVGGGTVLLTATAAAGLVEGAINIDGITEAARIRDDGGRIVLDGGTLSTAAGEAGANGGAIAIAAATVIATAGSRLDADGRGTGDGGTIGLFAGSHLGFAATTTARGGESGGDGGRVATLSAGTLLAKPDLDVSGGGGKAGGWRIETETANVVSADHYLLRPAKIGVAPGDGRSRVSAASIDAANGDIDVTVPRNLVINAPITAGNDVTLTARFIDAHEAIDVDKTLTLIAESVETHRDGGLTGGKIVINSQATPSHPDGGGTVSLDVATAEYLLIGVEADENIPFRKIEIRGATDLTVGDGSAQSGIRGGRVDVAVDGDLTLDGRIVATDTGTAIVVVTDRFLNNVGAGGLDAENGRWLIYSVDPAQDRLNGLAVTEVIFSASFESTPPESAPNGANVVFFEATLDDPRPAPFAFEPPENVLNEITRPVTINSGQVSRSASEALSAPTQNVYRAPPPAAAGESTLFFASEGNSQLWGLGGGQ